MPYPNFHACRLQEPGQFRDGKENWGQQEREHDGKKYNAVRGRKRDSGDWEDQSLRYDKDTWTADAARSHCEAHKGHFEAAKPEHGTERMRAVLPPVHGLLVGAETGRVQVNRKDRVIRGASIITRGIVATRGLQVDDQTLDMIAQFGNAQPRGIRARFTHPPVCADALGTYLGRWRNFRVDGDRVRADLHLAQVAFKGPRDENWGDYILNLAEEDPEALGVSIVYQTQDEETLAVPQQIDDTEVTCVLRPQRILAADVVDQPASNEGLFGGAAEIAQEARALFDKYGIWNIDPVLVREHVLEFLSTYLLAQEANMADSEKTIQVVTSTQTTEDYAAKVAALSAEHDAKVAALSTDMTKLRTDHEAALLAAQKQYCDWVTDVLARCELAQVPLSEARALIAKVTPLEEVKDMLLQALAKRNKALSTDGAGTVESVKTEDPKAKWRTEYDQAGGAPRLGVSFEDYAASLERTEKGGQVWPE